jgi:hypothetical protein
LGKVCQKDAMYTTLVIHFESTLLFRERLNALLVNFVQYFDKFKLLSRLKVREMYRNKGS